MLEVRDIDAYYGDSRALHGVSLSVGNGEVVTLVGSNGAGKTTTLRAIAGTHPIARGELVFEGNSLLEVPAHQRPGLGIALVPEGRELWPQLTVLENLELGSYRRGARAQRGPGLEAVLTVFPVLRARRQQLAGSLSGGEQQMLALGRGLMAQPDLLLLDEPSQGLGPRIVEQIFETIDQIRKSRRLTILLVEQRVVEALELCDRGYVLETGRVVLEGAHDALLADPRVQRAYLGV